jgi:hypothetical protein
MFRDSSIRRSDMLSEAEVRWTERSRSHKANRCGVLWWLSVAEVSEAEVEHSQCYVTEICNKCLHVLDFEEEHWSGRAYIQMVE